MSSAMYTSMQLTTSSCTLRQPSNSELQSKLLPRIVELGTQVSLLRVKRQPWRNRIARMTGTEPGHPTDKASEGFTPYLARSCTRLNTEESIDVGVCKMEGAGLKQRQIGAPGEKQGPISVEGNDRYKHASNVRCQTDSSDLESNLSIAMTEKSSMLRTGRKVFTSGRVNWSKYLKDEDDLVSQSVSSLPCIGNQAQGVGDHIKFGRVSKFSHRIGVPSVNTFLKSSEFWEYEASQNCSTNPYEETMSLVEQPLGVLNIEASEEPEGVKDALPGVAMAWTEHKTTSNSMKEGGSICGMESSAPVEGDVLLDESDKKENPGRFYNRVVRGKRRRQPAVKQKVNQYAVLMRMINPANDQEYLDVDLGLQFHTLLESTSLAASDTQVTKDMAISEAGLDNTSPELPDMSRAVSESQVAENFAISEAGLHDTSPEFPDKSIVVCDAQITEDLAVSESSLHDTFAQVPDIWSDLDDDENEEEEVRGWNEELAEEDPECQDLLKKFLMSRTGNRNSSTEGRVYKYNKKAFPKSSRTEMGVLVPAGPVITCDPGVPLSKPFVRGNEFLYPAPRMTEGSRPVCRPSPEVLVETPQEILSGASPPAGQENDTQTPMNLDGNFQFSSTLREVQQIAYNLPEKHVLEDYMAPYMNKVNVIQANLILEALCKEDLVDQARSFFRWMRFHEPCLLDPRSFSILFNFLGKVGMPDEALTHYQMLPLEIQFHSVQVYNTLITALTNCNRQSDIAHLLEQMQKWGTEPDSVTFSILMTLTRKRQHSFKEVWALYQGMIERGVSPNVTVFGSLIKAFCDAGSLKEALLVTTEMERLEIPLTTVIYNILIDAYGKAGQLEEAEGLVFEMKEKGIGLTVTTYNALIHGYATSRQFKVAEALISEMELMGLKPDVVTFTLLISAYGHAQMSEQAAQTFNRMQARGIAPNSRSYTALIHAYAEGRWHEKAAKVFERMQKQGVSPTVETFTALLDGYRRAGDINMVKEVWKAMKDAGCVGTRITYMTILDALSKHGHYKQARDIIEEFKNLGCMPDLMVYNMLLNAYARGGRHERTPEILKEIKTAGFEPDSFTYTTLIYAFLRVRDFAKALKYHREMISNSKAPGAKMYAKLRAIIQVVEERIEENNRKSNLGQQRRPGKNTERAKAFWKRENRPSRRLLK